MVCVEFELKILIDKNDFSLGTFLRSRVTHGYLITDSTTCICEAAENEENQLQVFYDNKTIPFHNFRWYYGKTIGHPFE